MNAKKFEQSVEEYIAQQGEEKLFRLAENHNENPEDIGYTNYSYWRSTWRIFRQNKVAMFLSTILILLLAFTFIQMFLPNQKDPNEVFWDGYLPRINNEPSADFWFGTTNSGQDLWSRTWSGTRRSLMIAIVVTAIRATTGIIIGSIWGYFRKVDRIFTEIYNVLNNIPNTIIMMLFSYVLPMGVPTMIFSMCVLGWLPMARFIRNQIIIIRDREYNMASRCLGTPPKRMIMKNLLPYLVSVIMMRLSMSIPAVIGSEVFLSYIGLGLPAIEPSLGMLISQGRQSLINPTQRYQLVIPTVVLGIITISFYVIGSAFADAADPKRHKK